MPLIHHPTGGYRFLPGIAPYSGGVVSDPGHEIVHATFHRPVHYLQGFALIEAHLAAEGRPKAALCGIELRSPKPYSFAGFAEFNAGYARILEDWGLFVDGVNPVARTNVAPELAPPAGSSLYGFSYSKPSDPKLPPSFVVAGAGELPVGRIRPRFRWTRPTFVVAGAGELPEGILSAEAIVRGGETSPDALVEKAEFVMGLMEARLHALGGVWSQVTAIDVYTIHPFDHLLPGTILKRIGSAADHGVRWFYTRPPIEGIEFEMDLRSVRTEIRLG